MIIAKKLCFLFVAFLMTISLTFFLMKVIPGDPFTNKKAIPKEILDSMYKHYGFNDPIYKQYIRYVASAMKGDLGPSFKYKGRQVTQIIKEGIGKSIQLGLQALLFSLVVGLLVGIFAAYSKKMTLFTFFTSLFVCIPSFILAFILQYLLAIKLHLFPIARWTGFSSTILPTLALSAVPCCFIAKLTRSSVKDLLKSDSVLLAKSKGLSNFRILFTYIFPAALSPIIAYLGFDIATILSGSFIVEKVFAIPGIGYALVTAVMNRDYTVIMGMTIFYSLLFLLAILLADITLLWLNPKLRSQQNG